jgi:hypothetical protein
MNDGEIKKKTNYIIYIFQYDATFKNEYISLSYRCVKVLSCGDKTENIWLLSLYPIL